MSTTLPPWLDPRPAPRIQPLAGRPATRHGRRLVLFDNGKLSPPYVDLLPIRVALEALLGSMGCVEVEAADIITADAASHLSRAQHWREKDVDGVVLALCDAAVTQATVLQAVAAEQLGIPTAILCTGQVMEMAATMASFLAPGIPLVHLGISRLMSAQQMAEEVEAAGENIARALTAAAPELVADAEARFPFVARLARPRGNAHLTQDFAAYAASHHMTDGLAVETPTQDRVDALISHAQRAADDIVIGSLSPSGAPLSVRQAAISAAMAACPPPAFRLVLAALDCMAAPDYRLDMATISTHPAGHVLMFSGPLAHAVGLASGRGCMGPGNPVNTAVARAVGLAMINAGRAVPGLSTLSIMGSPAQSGCCFADLEQSPYEDLATALAGPGASIVCVHRAEGPHNAIDHLSTTPESLLRTMASVPATLGSISAYVPGDMLVVLNPEHAQVLAGAGWSRADIQDCLWEHARNPRDLLKGRGVKPDWPPEWNELQQIPVARSPDRIWVVVAGAPGPHSMVSVPWGVSRAQWRRIE
jgi:hypothetical protein